MSRGRAHPASHFPEWKKPRFLGGGCCSTAVRLSHRVQARDAAGFEPRVPLGAAVSVLAGLGQWGGAPELERIPSPL